MSIIRVSVQPYVWKYLRANYGPDPFDLSCSHRNDLRLRFLNMGLNAEPIPQAKRLPGKWLLLDLGKDPFLLRVYRTNAELLKLGSYFQSEFFLILRKYVEAQRELAQKLGLPPGLWSQKQAIDCFLSNHGIEPHEYDSEAIYRQLNRLKGFEDRQFAEKMTKKYGFCQGQNEAFKLPRLSLGSRRMIYFHCFSRSRGELVRCDHRIPAKIQRSGDWLKYSRQALGVLSKMLQDGHTVK